MSELPSHAHEKLKAYLLARAPFDEAECAEVLSAFTLKRFVKKQFIVQPGFVALHRNFVVSGAIRAYVIDAKGLDHTIQLAVGDWWISDYNSYIFRQPATMFVSPVENSVVLQISYEQEEKLKQANHKFETFFRQLAERSVAFFQRRMISALTQDAEERYTAFAANYPALLQQMPQYVIASYLGMTTEFLSKIRNRKTKRKS